MMPTALAPLHSLLQRAQSVLLDTLDDDAREFHRDGLVIAERQLTDILKGDAGGECPQAWPMLAQVLRGVVGAQIARENRRAERWAAVAFALLPLVRADFEAIKRGDGR